MLNQFIKFWISRFVWLWRDQKGQLPGEVGAISHRWDLFEDAPELVQKRFDEMQETAIRGYGMAFSAIQELVRLAGELELINSAIPIDTTVIDSPTIDDLTPPTIDVSQFRIDFPTQPLEPTLIDATLDTIPSNFPELLGPGDVNAGDLSYVSSLMTALRAKLLSDVLNGSTGIPDAIQDAMFNKNYERDLDEYNDELDRIAANCGKGGFPYPGMGLRAAQNKAARDFSNKRMDVSRDIMIKSWEIALDNTHFVIAQGIAIEGLLIRWAESVATRVFEASKAEIDKQIRTYDSRVRGFAEKVRIIIEKCKAKIEYNIARIRMYEAGVNAYSAKMKAEAERVNAVARGYEAETEVFNSLVKFETSKVDLDLKVIAARIEQARVNADILIKNKDVELRAYEALMSLKEEAEKAIGMIAAQVAAGALSAIHAQVNIGASDSASYSAGSQLTEQT